MEEYLVRDLIAKVPGHSTPDIDDCIEPRLLQMSPMESRQLRAAMELRPPADMAEFAALTFHLHDFNFFYPVFGDDDLGCEVAKFEMGAREDVLPFLDHEKIGMEWRNKHGGVFLDSAFIQQCSDSDLERIQATAEQIRSGHIPAEQNWSAKVYIAASDGNTAWLSLPDYEPVNGGQADEIQVALDDLDEVFLKDCTLLEARCVLPQITDLASQYDDLEKLVQDANNLGYVLDERGQGMRWFNERFAAALDYEQCDRLDLALDISQNLHCYDYAPDDPDYLEEMGRGLVHNSRNNYNQTIKDAINYVALAESHLMNNKRYHKIDSGYFKRNDEDFVYEFSHQGHAIGRDHVRDPAEMTPEEIHTALNQKLDRCVQKYTDYLAGLHSSRLIGLAGEIAATNLVDTALRKSSYPTDELAYLLRFENPLVVARDAWLFENNTCHDEEFSHAMWSLRDKGDAEQDYALDPAYRSDAPEPVLEQEPFEMTME